MEITNGHTLMMADFKLHPQDAIDELCDLVYAKVGQNAQIQSVSDDLIGY
jgi:hypothetical protein